jgi:transposase
MDCELLLEILVKHPDRLEAPWKPETAELRLLAELVETRRNFVDRKTKNVLRLVSCLKHYYPQALEIIGSNPDSSLACDFLERWPEPEKLRRATPGDLRKFFRRRNCRSEKRIAKAIETAANLVPLTRDASILEGMRTRALSLVKLMRPLLGIVEDYDSRIAEVFKSCPDAFVFESLPGAGKALAPRLLCVMGTRRERFPQAAGLAQYVGCAPVTERSGKQISVHWRWSAPRFARQSFVEFAQWSVTHSVWARAYNEILKQRGDRAPTRMRKIAFKWTRILHRCWTQRVAYDEAAYIEALRRNNSPVWRKIQQLRNSEAAAA